ncbi:MAG TPA: hypothetical protein VF942_03325, partial [Acidimicrobiales bacterium]
MLARGAAAALLAAILAIPAGGAGLARTQARATSSAPASVDFPAPPPRVTPPAGGVPVSYHTPPRHQPALGPLAPRSTLNPLLTLGGTWNEMGPKPIFTLYSGNVSGLVSALAVDPTVPTTVYAGAVGGGVWKTNDGGGTWAPLTDDQPSLAIGSLAIDPSNHLVVYAGTGALYDGGRQDGAGILKSTDGGAHWAVVGNGTGTFTRHSVHQLVIDPSSTSTIYASTEIGIFKSIDAGGTWASIDSFGGVADIAMDAVTPSTIYVASFGGIAKSTDGGAHFSPVMTGLPTPTGAARISLGISHSNPNRLYTAWGQFGLSGCTVGVWRTDDGGGTWSQLPAPNMFAEPGTGLYCQGGYDNVTAVDPSNPDVAYIGGIDLWKITGAGATFANITNYFGGYPPVRVHPDYHSIAFVGNSSGFYVGNDGGVWSSGDGGATFYNLNTNLETALFYYGDAQPGVALGGLQDNGIVQKTSSLTWLQRFGGDGSAVAVDYVHPYVLYASIYGPQLIYKSGDGGATWTQVTNGLSSTDFCVCPDQPVAMDPRNPSVLMSGTFYSRVFRT